jgi:nudix-type nucleoside diphosphatase (YffH/AdpP family)
MKRKADKIKEENVYNGYLKIEEASIKYTDEQGKESIYSRQKIKTHDAVAGLIYNIDTESFVLVKQYRYPVHTDIRNGFIFEAIAGKIDGKEEPEKAFIRECKEEVGYDVKEKNLIYCNWSYSSPGYSSERIHYFLATVTNKDKIKGAGGGIKDENEDIEIIEIPYLIFKSNMDSLEDAKTKLLAFEAHYRKLFDIKL